MSVREELVASAVTFLRDPSVSNSPVESKIAFLQSKNLTQDEIDAALSSLAAGSPAQQAAPQQAVSYPPPQVRYQQPPPQYGWPQHQEPPLVPKRDWRDWFIMATVVGGVSYSVLTLAKRYITPLVVPPTPEKLDQDKKAIDDKFDRAFALIDQLSADTTELKNAEQSRTERLDKALSDLETVMGDLKTANRRREEDSQRAREDIQGLKDSIPRAMNTQKDLADSRLRDVNAELKSLKTLLGQRLAAPPVPAAATPATAPVPAAAPYSFSRPVSSTPAAAVPQAASAPNAPTDVVNGSGPMTTENVAAAAAVAAPKPSPFSSGMPASKAAIPAWQMSMMTKSKTAEADASSSESPAAPAAPAAASS